MKLYYSRKSENPTYYIQQSLRIGKKTTTKNVYKIGKHSELLKTNDNPLVFAQEYTKKYNEEFKKNKIKLTYEVNFDEKLFPTKNLYSKENYLNIGYFYLQNIYNKLKLKEFFDDICEKHKNTFNCNDINRFLTFSRMLNPGSKLSTCDKLDSYYEQPKIEYQHSLRFMDILEKNYDKFITHLYENSENIIKRDTSVCFYDCTNYYFETEVEDDDYVDDVTGEVIRGFKKFGHSKQHQPAPLVQMGLFMDKNGIPLSMNITSGADNEQLTVKSVESKLIKMLKNKKFIYCADAGLGSYDIRKFNSYGGKAFIVTQSVKKLSEALQKQIFEDKGYKLLSNSKKDCTLDFFLNFDRYDKSNSDYYNDRVFKVLTLETVHDLGLYEEKTCKNGKKMNVKAKGVLKQNVIVTFSRKMYEFQRKIRNRQIERANKLINTKDPEKILKGPNDVRRFIIKKEVKKEESQELKDNNKKKKKEKPEFVYSIDNKLIKHEEKYDGFYAIATNLLDDDPKEIFNIAYNRYKIEDCFRVLKTNFDARPIFHRNKERIIAHFMICYLSLLIYRIIENKLNSDSSVDYKDSNEYYYKKEKNINSFSINKILETLKAMNVVNIQDTYYQSLYTSSHVLTALNSVFGLELDKKYYLPKELNKKIKKIL